MSPKAVVVKRYKTEQEYQRDAQKMARQHYTVSHVVSEQRRSGCLRWVLIGPLALIFSPKAQFVVTYTPQSH